MRAWRIRSSVVTGTSLVLGLGMFSPAVHADQFHYNNVLVGTRSVGMGGAFGAVADDASGVYYNPAGLAFALSNDIQGSANAFYQKKTKYKKTLGNDDFDEESSGSLSPFFGGLQKLDRYVEGLVFAFGVYYVDGDLKDQDTLIEGETIGTSSIERYHRTSNARAATYYAGAAVGYRPVSNLAIGFGLNYFSADELVQEFQGVAQNVPVTLTGGPDTKYVQQSINVREHLTVYGMQPVFGVQLALPANLAVGLTLKQGIVASQHLDVTSERQVSEYYSAQRGDLDTKGSTVSTFATSFVKVKSDDPVGKWPLEARLGLAWFATPTVLMAFDANYHGAVDAPKLEAYGNKERYSRLAVTDLHAGVEWYVMPTLPLRFGAFTNNDSRPDVKKGNYSADAAVGRNCSNASFAAKYCGQPDHIDYLGESLFIAWVQPNSQISAGVVLQQGTGKAQKTGDHQVQDVTASSSSFAFSATHNL